MVRILLVTTEPVPLPGVATTGAGLRAWGLAQGLRTRGYEVEIAMASDAANNLTPERRRALERYLFERPNLTEHVRERDPDALVMQHWGLMDRLGDVDCPLAIDLAGPHLLERIYWGTDAPERDLEQKLTALARADFLTCSGRFQRHYFLGFAIQAGFDPTDPDLLPVIPLSVSPDQPPPAEYDPSIFVYSGLLLPWQDPSVSIEALLDTMEHWRKGLLRFIGGTHPSRDVSRGRFDAIIDRINASPRARFEPAVPFDDLQESIARCGVALDLMARNPERELAFTSRTVAYLAAGLPVIYNDYSELSEYIEFYKAGWLLDPDDRDAQTALFQRLLDSPSEIGPRRENARRLVRECLTWDKTIEPLAHWCDNPTVRADKQPPLGVSEQVDPLQDEMEALQARYDELAGRRLVKLSEWLRKVGLRRRFR